MFDTQSQPTTLALIGCGNMGLRHVYALVQMRSAGFRDLHLVAVCDTDAARATELAEYAAAHGLPRPRVETDLATLLADTRLDAVDVVVPNHLHFRVVSAALTAGKHALVEKPMTLATEDAATLARALRSGQVLAVAENFRRIPANRAFAALLHGGAFGTPRRMTMERHAAPDESYMIGKRRVEGARWYHDPSQSGSYHVFELGAHEVDLQTLWFGAPCGLRATETRDAKGLVRTQITLDFPSGMRSEITFQDTDAPHEQVTRQFTASNGSARSSVWSVWQDGELHIKDTPPQDLGAMTAQFLGGLGPAARSRMFPPGSASLALTASPSDPLSYGVGVVLADFARAIRSGQPPEVGVEDGYRVVAICAAVLKSIAAGGIPVQLAPDQEVQP